MRCRTASLPALPPSDGHRSRAARRILLCSNRRIGRSGSSAAVRTGLPSSSRRATSVSARQKGAHGSFASGEIFAPSSPALFLPHREGKPRCPLPMRPAPRSPAQDNSRRQSPSVRKRPTPERLLPLPRNGSTTAELPAHCILYLHVQDSYSQPSFLRRRGHSRRLARRRTPTGGCAALAHHRSRHRSPRFGRRGAPRQSIVALRRRRSARAQRESPPRRQSHRECGGLCRPPHRHRRGAQPPPSARGAHRPDQPPQRGRGADRTHRPFEQHRHADPLGHRSAEKSRQFLCLHPRTDQRNEHGANRRHHRQTRAARHVWHAPAHHEQRRAPAGTTMGRGSRARTRRQHRRPHQCGERRRGRALRFGSPRRGDPTRRQSPPLHAFAAPRQCLGALRQQRPTPRPDRNGRRGFALGGRPCSVARAGHVHQRRRPFHGTLSAQQHRPARS